MYLPPEPYSLVKVMTIFEELDCVISNGFVINGLLEFSTFFNFLTCNIKSTLATTNANPSAKGPAYNIPWIPNVAPNITIAGIKNKICLDKEITALFTPFPIAWKKIPAGIWIPLQMHNIKYVLNA